MSSMCRIFVSRNLVKLPNLRRFRWSIQRLAFLVYMMPHRCTHHQMFNLSEKIPEYLETKCQSNPNSAPGLSSHRECDQTDRFSWIGSNIPCFKLSGKQVNVLTEPTQFFETLKLKARKSRKRIIMASLYLGTGTLEQELVDSLNEACRQSLAEGNKDFDVHILLDYTRGRRGSENSCTILQPVLSAYPQNARLSLFHTPDLRGILKKIMPNRYNETIGLHHMKVYLFDDSLIISGANLSETYFTNRQDRYILFNNCPEMADFFSSLIKTVASFSFQVNSDCSVTFPEEFGVHPYEDSDDGSRFKWKARDKVLALLRKTVNENCFNSSQSSSPKNSVCNSNSNQSDSSDSNEDTFVYPLIQMGPLGILDDEEITKHLLRSATQEDEILLASGYFNLTDHYLKLILEKSCARFKIMMASPEVNGFYGASGAAGAIPYLYIQVARQFHQKLCAFEQQKRIQLYEYYRNKWTFHVKGLWYYISKDQLPSLTLIGSSNFGYRSVYRDLECQLAIITKNENLRQQLRQEHVHLFQSSDIVSETTFKRKDRYVPIWVQLISNYIKNFF
ncbi:CDP-diacylglycerol--glycerol-3-phosphate 3-phosphatidyltransferase, mitochondrial isoform X1 [Octopus bimaculoides]|uniref:CDP-diacylglycerol--glycerol-3-phosphate 3-phosphatidyltransferase, mitochondrial isoform X1 n=1 Tax=Octopus bimaculoides TaxID=37653 RepID=UPI00071E22C0|nr:CDP-diacylglycerol--glycerol-3-phosphate 3-phosphatidyltransferase, mitochondrial isoform X1 [Octopus bimaculoides]|eukprot:XP_014777063.1 PREDICTED: CDP-diacylglycerol--glycerol-3-phosphate 3-phosphatidyltransferase, mitochondrial-like isoform X1 [Octopus bimaculoides]